MRIFKIKNKVSIYGYLYVSKKLDNAYVELMEGDLDYPIYFNIFAQKGIYTINCDLTKKWILERAIPYERQNIAAILKENNLKAYNEFEMFILSKGKSSMDDTSIEEISLNEVSEQIIKRHKMLIQDFILDDDSLLVFFKNGITKIVKLTFNYDSEPFLSEFRDEIIFTSKERLSYIDLYKKGEEIKFSFSALKKYLANNILDANELAEFKGVTKQNISLQKKNGKLSPINDKYYLKNDTF